MDGRAGAATRIVVAITWHRSGVRSGGGCSRPAALGLTYVALGDSWVEGRPLRRLLDLAGLRGWAGSANGGQGLLTSPGMWATDSMELLASLRTDEIRAAVADADVVLIATCPNEGASDRTAAR